MKEELVSIIVPVYKVEQYLDRCINSLVNQTYKNIEIIVVEDGSPDNCPQICDDWAKKDNRIKVIHKKNGGLMAAWIDGLKASSADFISFVDSDDWVENNFIEEMITPFLNDKEVDLVCCNYYNAYDNYKVYVSIDQCNKDENILTGAKLQELKNHQSLLDYSRWNKLYKKTFILNNLQYCDTTISLGEDVCITRACFLDSNKIYYVKKPLYNYYFRQSSIVNSFNAKCVSDYLKVNTQLSKIFTDKKTDLEKNLSYELQHQMYFILKSIFWNSKTKKRTNFKSVLNSNFLKEYLKANDTYFSKRQKFIKFIIKTRSYLLMKLFFAILSKKIGRGKEEKIFY